MTDAVKLLTEADAEALRANAWNASHFFGELRERGLIAPEPEPVDPLLIEAREICAKVAEDWPSVGQDGAREYRDGTYDESTEVKHAIARLRALTEQS